MNRYLICFPFDFRIYEWVSLEKRKAVCSLDEKASGLARLISFIFEISASYIPLMCVKVSGAISSWLEIMFPL